MRTKLAEFLKILIVNIKPLRTPQNHSKIKKLKCFLKYWTKMNKKVSGRSLDHKLRAISPSLPPVRHTAFGKSARFQVPKNGTSSDQIFERTLKTLRNTPQNGGLDIWIMHLHFWASIKPNFENCSI